MPENDVSVVVGLLNSLKQDVSVLQQDASQIKTNLAVNSNDTKTIKELQAIQNSKVVKLEGRTQILEQDNHDTKAFIVEQQNLKRRRSDNRNELLQKLFLMVVGPLAIAIWQIVQYLINQDVFK